MLQQVSIAWIFALIITNDFALAIATKCDSVDGYWYNQLGSEMLIEEDNGVLIGEYRTAVERRPGAAGKSFSQVKGVESHWDSENLLGFSVIYNGGQSQAAWIGQCTKCGDKEVLRTTWLLRSRKNAPSDEWQSTRINEDVFVRDDNLEGPRRHLGTNTPRRSNATSLQVDPLSNDSSIHNIRGKWYSTDGVSLNLSYNDQGIINGSYTGFEIKTIPLAGCFEPDRPESTFGVYAIMTEPAVAFVGVGQYHRKEENEILETSWLQRELGSSGGSGGMSPVAFIRKTFRRTEDQTESCV